MRLLPYLFLLLLAGCAHDYAGVMGSWREVEYVTFVDGQGEYISTPRHVMVTNGSIWSISADKLQITSEAAPAEVMPIRLTRHKIVELKHGSEWPMRYRISDHGHRITIEGWKTHWILEKHN